MKIMRYFHCMNYLSPPYPSLFSLKVPKCYVCDICFTLETVVKSLQKGI